MDHAGTGTWQREFWAGRADPERARSKVRPSATPVRVRRGPRSYEDWSKHDLYERARELGIPHRSKMTKGELIRALRHR
jgi:Rho termination factor, N-terminal domain